MLYFFIGAGSLVSTAVANKIGMKASMVLGGLGHFAWVFSFIFPSLSISPGWNIDKDLFIFSDGFMQFFILFCSMLNGLGASILWVAQGNYIAECAPE